MSKKNQKGGKGYVSQNKSKEAKTLHYKKEVAGAKARRAAINAGKSQATADKARAKAEKAVTGNKASNLQEKRKKNAAAKKTPQKLSYWEMAKNKAKSLYNGAKTVYKNTKTKVSKALDKTWAGRQVKKVVRPFVKAGERAVKKGAQLAKSTYTKVIKPAAKYVKNSRFGKAVVKYGPKALKWGGKTLKWCSKRLPIVCTVVGGVEAAYYLYKGEYLKASVAATSAVVGNFPPVGTAIGIAAEAGIVGIDYYNAKQQEKAQQAAAQKAAAQSQPQQQQKTNTNTNAQEADSKTQTKTEDKAQHTSSVRDVRQTMHRDQQNRSNADITDAQSQTNQQSGNQQAEQQAQQQQSQQQQQQQQAQSEQQVQSEQQAQQQQAQREQQQQQTFGQQQQAQQQPQREQDGFNGYSAVSVANKGDEILVSYGKGQEHTISKEDLKARMGMSSRRAKGTMEKLQGAIAANSNTEGVIDAVSTYVPELKKDGKGTAKVNRNLVDSTVKAIGGSSKATSITIDGKKIKAKDIQASYGCSKKEAKQILKAYGRAIEDGANLDDVLRDIANGKKLDTSNQTPANNNEAMRAMMARRTMHDFS